MFQHVLDAESRKMNREDASAGERIALRTWGECVALGEAPRPAWLALCRSAADANPFYDADWVCGAADGARVEGPVRVLLAWHGEGRDRLIGLLPVVSAWSAMRLPLPVLLAWKGYGPLTMPLIDRQFAPEAWQGLRAAASGAGARAIRFRFIDTGSRITSLIDPTGEALRIPFARLRRARLDATQTAEAALQSVSPTNRRRLNRACRRLAKHGPIHLAVARTPAEVGQALKTFLRLEAGGWKAERGTALAQHAGDVAFIRQVAPGLAARGECEILTLFAGDRPCAAGLVLRQKRFATWFKIGIDWSFAKSSPGLVLAAEVTRHYCDDPGIDSVDSNSETGHSLVDAMWRAHYEMADIMVPLRTADTMLPALRAMFTIRESARRQTRSMLDRMRRRQAQ